MKNINLNLKQIKQKQNAEIKTIFKKLLITIYTIPTLAFATTGYNIGEISSGGFTLITRFFQKAVDFMTGPFAKGTIAITLIGAILLWIAMPREGVLGIICRVIIGALVILNIGIWMGMLGA